MLALLPPPPKAKGVVPSLNNCDEGNRKVGTGGVPAAGAGGVPKPPKAPWVGGGGTSDPKPPNAGIAIVAGKLCCREENAGV